MSEAQRRAVRMRDRVTVVVSDILEPGAEAPERGKSLSCRTADLSLGGARLSTEWQIPEGTQAKVTLVFKHPPAHFVHRGQIRWVKKSAEPGRYLTGLQFLFESDAPDPKWVKFLNDRFPETSSPATN